MRVIVFGMMGRCPFAGQSWLSLNWLRGFHQLGHDVWYVEDDECWPFDPMQQTVTNDTSNAVGHIKRSLETIGLPDRWAYRFGGDRGQCFGLSSRELRELYRSCDVLINFGTTDLREEHRQARLRVYVESDPVMSQLRLANGDAHTQVALESHDVLFSYGENYGAADCGVPLGGLTYKPTRQAIDLEFWHYSFDPGARHFTTVGNYRQSGNDLEFNGKTYYWSKHLEWEKILDLPRRTRQTFELALSVDMEADPTHLTRHGWAIVSPYQMSLDIFGAYPAFIRASRAELTVAKDQNVRLRSGWFSERDACYLACGKPVIAQDTGFSNILPTGEGLFAFTNMDEVLAAIDAINTNYPRQCRSARALAEEYFEASRVAQRLLDQLDGAAKPRLNPAAAGVAVSKRAEVSHLQRR